MTKALLLNAARKARKQSKQQLEIARKRARGWSENVAEALAFAFLAMAYEAEAKAGKEGAR